MERLHALLDSRNAAAVFNATAMAAGGGRGIDGCLNPNFSVPAGLSADTPQDTTQNEPRSAVSALSGRASNEDLSGTSVSGSEFSSEVESAGGRRPAEIWGGELSSVIGLQKRGLRGLMEGRRMRERTGTGVSGGGAGGGAGYGQQARVGLGIAGS